MTKRVSLLLILAVSGLFSTRLYAQKPVLSYSPAANIYTVNTTISTLSPTNTGGAVSSGALTDFATIPGTGTGSDQPYGITYDPTTGDIITDNFGGDAVYRYSPSGVLLNTYTTSINGPKDLVVDASGNIYVGNSGNADVVKITPAGVTTTITTGFTAGTSQPDGMCIDAAGNIYVGDQGTNKVYKIAPGATTATVYASGFTNAYGVAVNDATGIVYVSQFTPTANIMQIPAGGGTPTIFISKAASGFTDLRNLDIDAAGNLYVANYGANSISKITPAGVVSTVVTGLTSPRATAEDVFGNLYVANSGGFDIEELSPANYSINIPLPAGMSFNTTTGQISGTPTVTSVTTTYTIAGHNASGTGYTTVVITIDPTTPTTTGDFNCGPGTVNLSVSGGLPAGGTYNWYAASSGGASLNTGSTYNPSPATTTTYYVDYTQGGVSCAARVAVVGAISADPVISSAPTSGAYFSYSFTGGITTDISGANNGTLHGAPATTADRYSTSGNAYSFASASSQYISTATAFALPGPQTFSISVWFKTSTAGGYLAGYGSAQTGNSGTVDRVIYMGTNGELYFGVAPLGVKKTINTITTYNDNTWHHVVATFSAANGSNMYVDGSLAASDPTMTTAFTYITTGYWRVAYDVLTGWTNAPATAAATYFNGALDDIAVANTELTAAQVNVFYGAGSGAFCSGNTLSLTANTVAGATYSWVGPAGSGFTSSSQNPTVPAANAIAGTYVLTVTNATGCQSTINVTAPGNVITYTWSGAAGTTNPATAGNWDHLPLFTSTSNLVIPTGLAKYPVLLANESAYNVTLGATATLTLNGFTLSVGCDIINNASTSGDGILYGGNLASGITWNGSVAAQRYTGTNTTNTASLADMTVNNSAGGTVTINSGPVDIYDVITLTKGNLVIAASPAALTLKCSATQAASVAAIPAAYSVSGNVTVERYISGGSGYRSYRLLSSPVYNATPSASLNVFSLNYLQTGMYLTGTAGGGFDKTGNPTIYLYREDIVPSNTTFTSGNFWGISAINNSPSYNYYLNNGATAYNLPAGTGVMFFFRGNRATTTLAAETVTTYTSPSAVTLSTTGTLNQGPVLVKSWYNSAAVTLGYSGSGAGGNHAVRGFNLVGNPYASSIDWSTFSNSSSAAAIYGVNIAPTVWIFNPHTKAYDTYNALTHIATGSASNIIPTGQGFFVQATAVSPTLTFQEASKTSTQVASGNLLMDRRVALNAATAQGAYDSYLRLNLITDTADVVDMVVGFNSNTSTAYDQQLDAKFVKGSGSLQTLAGISSDSVNTAVKWLPFPKSSLSQVIRLFVNASNYGTYTLQRTDFKAIPAIYDVWLMDSYKKDSLDIRNNTTYIFDITTDTNSYGGNRFSLVIHQNPALMVHLLQFTATKVVNGAQSVWATENEQNYTNFAVERSTDGGATYNVLGGFASSGQGTYDFLDKTPVNGANLYRLQMTDLNGTITYSKPVTLMYGNTNNNLVKSGVVVYPNPAKTTLNLNIAPGFNNTVSGMAVQNSASPKAGYNIQIVNILGVMVTKATTTTQNWQTDVNSLTPGTYVVKVVNSKDNSLVGESTFVKL